MCSAIIRHNDLLHLILCPFFSRFTADSKKQYCKNSKNLDVHHLSPSVSRSSLRREKAAIKRQARGLAEDRSLQKQYAVANTVRVGKGFSEEFATHFSLLMV
jgi:hypothetical protein